MVADEFRRRFDLEGEAALLLRLNLPVGDPWRPDPVERRAALAWILENQRSRVAEVRDAASLDDRTGTAGDNGLLFAAGLLLGMLLGAGLGYILGQL